MSQRTLAGLLALPLVVGLWLVAVFVPLPYVTYSPGLTVDVLGESQGDEIVQVSDDKAHRDSGELLLTTVYVTRPNARVNLFEVMAAWFDRDKAVLPYEAVYSPDQSREDVEFEGAVQMASSQDVAVAVAMQRLGFDVPSAVEVLLISDGMPADGVLERGDVILAVGDKAVSTPQDVVDAVDAAKEGDTLSFTIRRARAERTVEVQPRMVEGDLRIGITPAQGYEFPFDVDLNIDPSIGGSSAGLMFSLGVYDTLTPGSLTDGATIAGTGTMAADGTVGPIGGVAQKIASARDAGAELFMVPASNCEEALGARPGDMRLVRADKFNDALTSIEAWVDDPDAALPSCDRKQEK
ncbi:PDZ domain-containing protein [Nocardioides daphniae]|uniref:PDZ domain-containing protein n=1 Tax=Nocardioides daphniae TaxID=402297 RepID=A0A4V1CWM6_9ACTN|nr:PDZ domain-containing protein [Nocardioides daphniae]QCC77797.1 PDZ domain-containing protein [Nocardioides daphniae]GGD28278.1 hypothetical protein GCM10007231_29750 [Nocardioides daphniae]